MKEILVIGGTATHMYRWMKYVSSALPNDTVLDIFCTKESKVPFDGARKTYYAKPTTGIYRLIKRIPKVRLLSIYKVINESVNELIDNGNYKAIIIHQLSPFYLNIIKRAKRKNIKVVLTPWGSDILRIPHCYEKRMEKIFYIADYVTSNAPSFYLKLKEKYHFEDSKLVYAGFGSEVLDCINSIKAKYNKIELAESLSIPKANYYIACGYNGDRAQRHLLMIDAIEKNKEFLPEGTMLIFQFTYGDTTRGLYKKEVEEKCIKNGLNFHFLTSYLSNEDMAKYRLLTDLFIHIQPTDAANTSLQEFLLADTTCINGEWLKYPQLEEFGLPYFVCNSLKQLPSLLGVVLNEKLNKIQLSDRLMERISQHSWDIQKSYWADFLKKL